MTKDDLLHLKKNGVLRGFEVLEEDTHGNVTGMTLWTYGEPNRLTLSSLLRAAYERVKRKNHIHPREPW